MSAAEINLFLDEVCHLRNLELVKFLFSAFDQAKVYYYYYYLLFIYLLRPKAAHNTT